GDPQVAVGAGHGAAWRPDGAFPRGRGDPLSERAVAGERRADDAALVRAAVAGEPAERRVHPSVDDGQPGALLVEGRLVRGRRDVEVAVQLDGTGGRVERDEHVVVAGDFGDRV